MNDSRTWQNENYDPPRTSSPTSSPNTSTIIYLVETDKNFFKVHVPATYRVSYGPLHQGNPKDMALRLYDDKRLAAIFHNVVQFRQADIHIELGEFHQATGTITWTDLPLVDMQEAKP